MYQVVQQIEFWTKSDEIGFRSMVLKLITLCPEVWYKNIYQESTVKICLGPYTDSITDYCRDILILIFMILFSMNYLII